MSSLWSRVFGSRSSGGGGSESDSGGDEGGRWGSRPSCDIGEEKKEAPVSKCSSSSSIPEKSAQESTPGHAEEDNIEEQRNELTTICNHLKVEDEEIRHHRDVMNPTLVVRNDGYSIPLFSSFFASCEGRSSPGKSASPPDCPCRYEFDNQEACDRDPCEDKEAELDCESEFLAECTCEDVCECEDCDAERERINQTHEMFCGCRQPGTMPVEPLRNPRERYGDFNCPPGSQLGCEPSWQPEPLYCEEVAAPPPPAEAPASSPPSQADDCNCGQYEDIYEPPPLDYDACPPEGYYYAEDDGCDEQPEPEEWECCCQPAAPPEPEPECVDPLYDPQTVMMDEDEEIVLEDITLTEDLGADDYCWGPPGLDLEEIGEIEVPPPPSCGCAEPEPIPEPVEPTCGCPTTSKYLNCPRLPTAVVSTPVIPSTPSGSCLDRARIPKLEDLCPEYVANKKEVTVAEPEKQCMCPCPCPEPEITVVEEECPPQEPEEEECPTEPEHVAPMEEECPPVQEEECQPPEAQPQQCVPAFDVDSCRDCSNLPKIADICPERELPPPPACGAPAPPKEEPKPDSCECSCQSGTPPPASKPVVVCGCSELPKDVKEIVSKAAQLAPSPASNCSTEPPPCRRVICYICDYGDTEKPTAPSSKPGMVDPCDRTPPEVSTAEIDENEAIAAPVPAEPECCTCTCGGNETVPEPECAPVAEEPVQPVEAPPEEPPCPPEPEPEPVKKPVPCPPPRIPKPCPVEEPPAPIKEECKDDDPRDPPPPPPPPVPVEERISQLRDRNSRFMNKFCGCRQCTASGGCCEETETDGEYKCDCPECGEVRGENPECRMCKFSACMDDQVKKSKEVDDSDCDCDDCVRDRCNRTSFDLNPDGTLKYEGGMCLKRAQLYMWKATESKEPNSYNLLAFEDQQDFTGFGSGGSSRGCCTCECTCGECEGRGGGYADRCRGVDKKYRGGMTLQEVQDWSWCHDR